jgi:hypothetical protein
LPYCQNTWSLLASPKVITAITCGAVFVLAAILSLCIRTIRNRANYEEEEDNLLPKSPHARHRTYGATSAAESSRPFLESLTEVIETTDPRGTSNKILHRTYFSGNGSFSDPWKLQTNVPRQLFDVYYPDEYSIFAEKLSDMASYEWWEGAVHSLIGLFFFGLSFEYAQWRKETKAKNIRLYVERGYKHQCVRSCRARALHEAIAFGVSADFTLAHIDYILQGDEPNIDKFDLKQSGEVALSFPVFVALMGEGTYMLPFRIQTEVKNSFQ